MHVHRLAKAIHIRDLSGAGARISGGRWNEKGTAVVCTAESRALATVEYLVHVPLAVVPAGLCLATLEVPDGVPRPQVAVGELPPNWKNYPPPPELARIGTRWLAANSGLLLFVPSAVVPGEFNILVNPAHPDMRRVGIIAIEGYRFDQRLLK
jgi:RES domain-containing protein